MQTRKHDKAFPNYDEEFGIDEAGLTKREYFAVRLLQGLLANPDHIPVIAVKVAVQKADELIEMLNKTGSNSED